MEEKIDEKVEEKAVEKPEANSMPHSLHLFHEMAATSLK